MANPVSNPAETADKTAANDNVKPANDNVKPDAATAQQMAETVTKSADKLADPPVLTNDPGEDKPVETPVNWPANWRDIASGGDTKTLQYLNRYASPANVVKALMGMRAKMDSGELLRSKPDGTDEAALNEWRAQVGIPEAPEKYLDKLPDGLVVGDDDKPIIETFLKDMHAADAPPALVHTALGWWYKAKEEAAAKRVEADLKFRETAQDELRSEWGPEYGSNLKALKNWLAGVGDGFSDRLMTARLSDGNMLGNDPAMMRWLVSLNRELNPSGIVVPTPGKTAGQAIQDEIRQLEAESADQHGPYWKGPHAEAKQARLRELYTIEERMKGRAA